LTTVALGLVKALDRKGIRVAFFKPITQTTEDDCTPERSTHFIRATMALQPADPIPPSAATKTISERGLDELMRQVIAAYGASTASADLAIDAPLQNDAASIPDVAKTGRARLRPSRGA
jgi:phosphate acetyltransferase